MADKKLTADEERLITEQIEAVAKVHDPLWKRIDEITAPHAPVCRESPGPRKAMLDDYLTRHQLHEQRAREQKAQQEYMAWYRETERQIAEAYAVPVEWITPEELRKRFDDGRLQRPMEQSEPRMPVERRYEAPVIMGIDPAVPGSDQAVASYHDYVQDARRQIAKATYVPPDMMGEDAAGNPITGAEGADTLSKAEIDEAVQVAHDTEPVRVVIAELLDGRMIYFQMPGDMGEQLDLGKVRETVHQALACYQREERLDGHSELTLESWPRARFEALPEEYGFGRIIDGVWPADALRIPGVCPRTDNHHRPADHGRFCRACGRGRSE